MGIRESRIGTAADQLRVTEDSRKALVWAKLSTLEKKHLWDTTTPQERLSLMPPEMRKYRSPCCAELVGGRLTGSKSEGIQYVKECAKCSKVLATFSKPERRAEPATEPGKKSSAAGDEPRPASEIVQSVMDKLDPGYTEEPEEDF